MQNPLPILKDHGLDAATIRVRAVGRDQYEGLRGAAYIHARRLNAPVRIVQTSAQTAVAAAEEK